MNYNITLIAAMADQCRTIGKNDEIPWHIKEDFKRFKKLTSGHKIIMGRKTFESLPGILPNREHIVLTRNTEWSAKGVKVVNSVDEALSLLEGNEKAFVIGGEKIYEEFMPFANSIELTHVFKKVEGGDAFFPPIDLTVFRPWSSELWSKDEDTPIGFAFNSYYRK